MVTNTSTTVWLQREQQYAERSNVLRDLLEQLSFSADILNAVSSIDRSTTEILIDYLEKDINFINSLPIDMIDNFFLDTIRFVLGMIEGPPLSDIELLSRNIVIYKLIRNLNNEDTNLYELGGSINDYRLVTYILFDHDKLFKFEIDREKYKDRKKSIFIDKNEEGLTCSILLGKTERPVMIHCGHVFDEEELKKVVNKNPTDCCCPICRSSCLKL